VTELRCVICLQMKVAHTVGLTCPNPLTGGYLVTRYEPMAPVAHEWLTRILKELAELRARPTQTVIGE
jgi:hypothetical protein